VRGSTCSKRTHHFPVFRQANHLLRRSSGACPPAVTPSSGCRPASPAVPQSKPRHERLSWSLTSLRRVSTRESIHEAANLGCAARRVSHPLDGFFLAGTSDNFHAGNAHGIPALQGFSPSVRPRSSSLRSYPPGVLSGVRALAANVRRATRIPGLSRTFLAAFRALLRRWIRHS